MQPTRVIIEHELVVKVNTVNIADNGEISNIVTVNWIDSVEQFSRKLIGKDTNFTDTKSVLVRLNSGDIEVQIPSRFVNSIKVTGNNGSAEKSVSANITDVIVVGLAFMAILVVNIVLNIKVIGRIFRRLLKYFGRFSKVARLIESSEIVGKMNKFGSKFYLDGLIKFDYKTMLVIGASLLFFVILVVFRISGSSVGAWDEYFSEGKVKDSTSLIGSAKMIRSDEWLVKTTSDLSQVNNDFPLSNPALGAANTPVVWNIPIKDVLITARPQFWGYFVFGAESGISWEWGFKSVITFVTIFLTIMILTNNRFVPSLLGAFWIMYSSFTQWWFSANTPELIGLIAFMYILIAYLLRVKSSRLSLLIAILLGTSLVNFALYLYPPFLIPLGYILVALIVADIIKIRKELFTKKVFWKKLFWIIISVIVVAVFLFHFYQLAKETINLTLNTAYPGKREAIGGDQSLLRLFSGFYTPFMTQSFFAEKLGNVSEASSFVLYGVLLLPVYVIGAIKKLIKVSVLEKCLLVYIIAVVSWVVLPIPAVIAKITFLSWVPTYRSIIGLGVASIFLTVIFFSRNIAFNLTIKKKVIALSMLLVSFTVVGLAERSEVLGYYPGTVFLIVFSVYIAVGFWALLVNSRKLFALVLVGICAMNILVNPVVIGLEPLNPAKNSILQLVNEHKDGTWVAYGMLGVADYIRTTGANVINGSKYTPDFTLFNVLDPEKKYIDIYNRYAHIAIAETESSEVAFNLGSSDVYTVTINPCNEKLKQVGVKYAIFSSAPKTNYNCLVEIPVENKYGFKVFEIK